MKVSTRDQYEKYVVGIEMAKRLKVLNRMHHPMFFWVQNPVLGTIILYRAEEEYFGAPEDRYAAPTAAEIKDIYPMEIWVTTAHNSLHRKQAMTYFTKFGSMYQVSLMVRSEDTQMVYEVHREEDINEANACGAMLLYICENDMAI